MKTKRKSQEKDDKIYDNKIYCYIYLILYITVLYYVFYKNIT